VVQTASIGLKLVEHCLSYRFEKAKKKTSSYTYLEHKLKENHRLSDTCEFQGLPMPLLTHCNESKMISPYVKTVRLKMQVPPYLSAQDADQVRPNLCTWAATTEICLYHSRGRQL
jgi:hypothetical protein